MTVRWDARFSPSAEGGTRLMAYQLWQQIFGRGVQTRHVEASLIFGDPAVTGAEVRTDVWEREVKRRPKMAVRGG